MRAITVLPGTANSGRLDDVPEPDKADGALLVRSLALGICGTDREILAAAYGAAPPGSERLILGHESFGVVEEAPAGCGFSRGDHVVGIVRRPDPVPCPCCAAGEWDMCRNGRYTERGIKERHGFGSEHFRLEPDFAIKMDKSLGANAVLLEPTTVVAKGWDHADHIARRARTVTPRRLLVTGAGPVGLLAALLGKQRMLDVHVLDRAAGGPKADLTQELGGTYHSGSVADVLKDVQPDIVMECTAAPTVVRDVLGHTAPNGIVCLLGVSSPKVLDLDLGTLNHNMVLKNHVVFGSVNANRSHFEAAARALGAADGPWLSHLISRRVPLARWHEAIENRPDDIKVVVDFAA